MTGLPPEKFVCLHPVRKELQLERVGLTAPGQVIVELYKGGDFCKTQIFKYFYLGYETAHEEVVVVVSEQGEALIGDGHWVTIGTRGSTSTRERKMVERKFQSL